MAVSGVALLDEDEATHRRFPGDSEGLKHDVRTVSTGFVPDVQVDFISAEKRPGLDGQRPDIQRDARSRVCIARARRDVRPKRPKAGVRLAR